MTVLDWRCVSWTLQTSLDKPVHPSTLNHLITMAELTDFDPALIVDCFNAFVACVSLNNRKVVIMQGLEQLAMVAVKCLLLTLRRFVVKDPTSSILTDLRRCYVQIFPFETDFRGFPFYHTMTRIHALANRNWEPRYVWWPDYKPYSQELVPSVRHMVEVPRWKIRRSPVGSSALHSTP